MKHPFLHGAHNAGRFQDQSVVDRYHLRPTYPPETFTILGELIVDEPRAVLDVGCGMRCSSSCARGEMLWQVKKPKVHQAEHEDEQEQEQIMGH
jgi:hypothetical protein